MREGYSEQIRKRIEQSPAGTVFIHSDFTRIAGTETVRRSLNRFTQTGHLRRILNGVYEKPKYSQLLHEYVAVNPDAVANAIARNYHWTIAPCGEAALNLLGLSTQVPAVWVYVRLACAGTKGTRQRTDNTRSHKFSVRQTDFRRKKIRITRSRLLSVHGRRRPFGLCERVWLVKGVGFLTASGR